ncbi:4-hydroxy-tetrahydrodipicolinate synthase [Fistulifera solaris]|jgi:4-hydroxy-tetrahydrodipicolinate synthase|uniref:4-hydroxy-tetrahydrodipicolinate synthase n=1 Tax=Fistulifera solaris TaxID=1519565 RepID=A0A1Z5KD12_FISSO|nr:4-hydroxy-tetrahydrodipicolinate synthase [Fistulifera solaris]|eukprot:GAX24149.1 4-hydroxy-tetrahydrodipicolinate synthase [Fistulifera solaris]
MVTPMSEKGDIDYDATRNLLQWHIDQGTDNLCILGTTGEASVLSAKERTQVLRLAVEVCKGKIPIIAGVGTIDPQKVKDMTLEAMDLGCDAGLLVSPYYVKPPQRGLLKHFTSIADIGLPIVLYNVPGRTAVDISDETIAMAAEHDNIIAVKDATGKVERLASLKVELEKRGVANFLTYSGDDATTLEFVRLGGDGGISVTANCAPRLMHEMIMAAQIGDLERATLLNRQLQPLHDNLFCEANPIPAKYAIFRMGKATSPFCRPPLDALDPLLYGKVDEALHHAGVL